MPPIYPLINGKKYDFSNIEILANNVLYTGATEISYTHSLEPGELRGTRAGVIATTRGVYSAEGSITMPVEDADFFVKTLGPGWMETQFQVVVTYRSFLSMNVHALVGCRVTSDENSQSQGGDPSTSVFSLHIMEIHRDGIPPTLDGLMSIG